MDVETVTEQLPPIIQTYESLEKQLQEFEQVIQSLETNRELTEERLERLLHMAHNAKEIEVDIKYPVDQIKELDGVLIEMINSIKSQVAEMTEKETEFENVKAQVENEGWTKILKIDMIYEWIKLEDELAPEEEFITQLNMFRWVPKMDNPDGAQIGVLEYDAKEKKVIYNVILPYGTSEMWCSLYDFQRNFKPID